MPNFKLTNKPLSSLSITSEQGLRIHPSSQVKKVHTGIDFRASIGTSVMAAHSGTVIKAGTAGGIGKVIVIKDKDTDMLTLYGHLSDFASNISFGSVVVGGQEIGRSGDGSPYVQGLEPHLHFEIIDGSQIYGDKKEKAVDIITSKGRGEIVYPTTTNSLGIFSSRLNPILNPRLYFSDLAIDLALQDLSSSDSNYSGKTFNQLSSDQQKQVYIKSCEIFGCDVDTFLKGIAIEGDKRDNDMTSNSRDNKLSGGEGKDNYYLTDLLSGGFDQVDDKDGDGAIYLGGVKIEGVSAVCVTDSAGGAISSAWSFEHDGVTYYATRVDNHNVQSETGSNLLIVPFDAVDSRNSLRINNFDFAK